MLHVGEAVRSGTGSLVLWVVKREMLPISDWMLAGVWPVVQGRGCPFGGACPVAVLGEKGNAANFCGGISRGRGFLCVGEVARSGTGFLVLWLVKVAMLPILGWIFVGAWVVAQGRRCPSFGCGFPGAVGGKRGKCCPFWDGFSRGRVLLTGGMMSVRGRVSWGCGKCRGKRCPFWGGFSWGCGLLLREDAVDSGAFF